MEVLSVWESSDGAGVDKGSTPPGQHQGASGRRGPGERGGEEGRGGEAEQPASGAMGEHRHGGAKIQCHSN